MPASLLVLGFASVIFLFAMLITEAVAGDESGSGLLPSIMVSVMGYVFYWLVLAATGFTARLIPTISSIMACGSILTILMVITFVALSPLLGVNLASVTAWLILIWSVPVKGHIIARAIEQHWYIGISIALTIYIIQWAILDTMTANPGS